MVCAIIARTRNWFNVSSPSHERYPRRLTITYTHRRLCVSNALVLPLTVTFIILYAAGMVQAQSDPPPSELPLLHLTDFQYVGAFRLPRGPFGSSSTDYAQGPIEYNSIDHSMFMVGHAWHQEIAEFPVPLLVASSALEDLNTAGTPLQYFSPTVLNRASDGNPQNIDRIKGMEYVVGPNGPELLVNGQEYYDAPADNTHTTLTVRNANTIENSRVDGYFSFPGGAHASGWLSPIPPAWQSILGGTHITGNSSGTPIIGRHSVGPSAFVFDAFDIVGNSSVSDPVNTTTLLDFSLTNPLHDDLMNDSLTNDLWTHISEAVYGFIVPGTRTYVTLGHSGGHNSGICYKCTPSGGETCGGYCAKDSNDYYHYYWLWDVNDLVDVGYGSIPSYAPRPYEYGELPLPFQTRSLGGGTFDPTTGLLYIAVLRADNNIPVIVAYRFNIGNSGNEPANHAPLAQDDTFIVAQNTLDAALPVLLDNGNGPDRDPDPYDILTITSLNTTGTQGTAVLNNNGTPDDQTDDVINYTPPTGFSGTDYFSYSIEDNGKLSDTAMVTIAIDSITDGLVVNGNMYAIQSYGGSQDVLPTAFSTEDDGTTLHLTGNTWKAVALSPAYAVTADTMLAFDFISDGEESEINGIGLDSQSQSMNAALSFALAGSQAWGIRDFYGYGGGWQHYVIPIGHYIASGDWPYLFFINDADAGQSTSVRFRNIQISEDSDQVNAPDVVGLEEATAKIKIGSARLNIGTFTTRSSNTVPAGNVVSQNPAAGTSVPIGSAVDCVISSGDTVTITRANYHIKSSRLRVEASSSNETASLYVYAMFDNLSSLVGSIEGGGGKLTTKVDKKPTSVQVVSDKGGSDSEPIP